ncbi:hypothetical protein [Limisalsivibrio acetivorans]|uniref:hypothetical protein n=1 Tax=Limisalsivibrio acetivorans TaxID=1304888 RepID=UPI0004199878|nr:hypothetical protein [Limisalsivibrio acetivorans]
MASSLQTTGAVTGSSFCGRVSELNELSSRVGEGLNTVVCVNEGEGGSSFLAESTGRVKALYVEAPYSADLWTATCAVFDSFMRSLETSGLEDALIEYRFAWPYKAFKYRGRVRYFPEGSARSAGRILRSVSESAEKGGFRAIYIDTAPEDKGVEALFGESILPVALLSRSGGDIRLGYINMWDWVPFITKTFEARDLSCSGDEARAIAELSSGHPRHTIGICSEILSSGNKVFGKDTREKAFRRYIRKMHSEFRRAFSIESGGRRKVLSALAGGHKAIYSSSVLELFGTSAAVMQKGASNLRERGVIIEEKGDLRIKDPVYGEWVRAQTSFFPALRDL